MRAYTLHPGLPHGYTRDTERPDVRHHPSMREGEKIHVFHLDVSRAALGTVGPGTADEHWA